MTLIILGLVLLSGLLQDIRPLSPIEFAEGKALVSSGSGDESSVVVESPTLFINRTPQKRAKSANLDARPQVPQSTQEPQASETGSVQDTEVVEMLSGDEGLPKQDDQLNEFQILKLNLSSSRMYIIGGALVLVALLIITSVVWWFVCRPKPVPRRFNPRYDGPPPKRLSKLSFRAMRYSLTGNSPLRSNRYRSSVAQMQPSQISTISATSAP